MKKRVIPFGFEQYLITINMNELPKDIQDELKILCNGKLKDVKEIMICGTVEEDTKGYLDV